MKRTVSAILADDRHDGRHDDRDRGSERHDSRDWRHDSRDWRHDRFYDRGHYAPRYRAGLYRRPHGYYVRSWRHGDHLPIAYRAPRYVIDDCRAYRLYAPPRGYHWVRVDHDVLLTAIATGIVLDVIYDRFY
jgi:Ni/Co efflux regulator RcnB